MNEITRICDEVIFLDHGKIVAQDSPLGLTKRIKAARLQLIFEGERSVLEAYLKKQQYSFSFLRKQTIIITTEEDVIPGLIFAISKLGIHILDIEIMKPTLEDVFLQIARGEAHET